MSGFLRRAAAGPARRRLACLRNCRRAMASAPPPPLPGPVSALPRLPAAATAAEVAAAIARDGAVVIERLVPTDTMDRLVSQLSAAEGTFYGAVGSFAGHHSVRNAGKPLGESAIARELAEHPVVLEAIEERLRPNCRRIVLGTCSYISVEPPPEGQEPAPPQVLHRDESMWAASGWPWMPHGPERPELAVSVMWAATDFTQDNGATRLVPGSHRWPRGGGGDAAAAEASCEAAAMAKGSALLWSGGALHGAGGHAPRGRDLSVRRGLLFIYNLGWLRSEHNFHFAVPRPVLESFAPRLKELVGLAGENPASHPWYVGPVYAQPYLGGAYGTTSGEGVQYKAAAAAAPEEEEQAAAEPPAKLARSA